MKIDLQCPGLRDIRKLVPSESSTEWSRPICLHAVLRLLTLKGTLEILSKDVPYSFQANKLCAFSHDGAIPFRYLKQAEHPSISSQPTRVSLTAVDSSQEFAVLSK